MLTFGREPFLTSFMELPAEERAEILLDLLRRESAQALMDGNSHEERHWTAAVKVLEMGHEPKQCPLLIQNIDPRTKRRRLFLLNLIPGNRSTKEEVL
jgi:hypothetical protein